MFGGVAEWRCGGRWMVVVVGGGRVIGLRCGSSRRFWEACRGHVVVEIVDTGGGDGRGVGVLGGDGGCHEWCS